MKKLFNNVQIALISSVMFAALPSTTYADSDGLKKNNKNVVIYFTRHAEKQTELMENADGSLSEICGVDKCAEILNPEGELRARLLADWFEKRGITGKLTHAFSSHKNRTRQTIEKITEAAGLTGDFDKNPNDGIQEYPVYKEVIEVQQISEIDDVINEDFSFASELSPESTSPSEQPVIDALLGLEDGSVALVAGHSGTLYDIMYGIGLEDSCTVANIEAESCNAERYPFNAKKKVANFGDIWKVTLKNGTAKFRYRKNLQMTKLIRTEIVR